jgi:hypothetical protein
MTDELIIQQLKDKEAHLINELNKVRLALRAFIEENNPFLNTNSKKSIADGLVPKNYEVNLTWGNKILFLLYIEEKPMLVDELVIAIKKFEPDLETDKLHKTVSHKLSMLAKYSRVKKHPFNRKIKYSL